MKNLFLGIYLLLALPFMAIGFICRLIFFGFMNGSLHAENSEDAILDRVAQFTAWCDKKIAEKEKEDGKE